MEYNIYGTSIVYKKKIQMLTHLQLQYQWESKVGKFKYINYLNPQACKHAYNSCSKLRKHYSAIRFPIIQVFFLNIKKSLNAITETIYERKANPTVYKIPFAFLWTLFHSWIWGMIQEQTAPLQWTVRGKCSWQH